MDKHVNYSEFNLQLLPLWCFFSQPKLKAMQAGGTHALWSWEARQHWYSVSSIQIPVSCSVTFWVPHFPSIKNKCIAICEGREGLPVSLVSKRCSGWYCHVLFSSLFSLPWVLLVCLCHYFPATFLFLLGNFVACFFLSLIIALFKEEWENRTPLKMPVGSSYQFISPPHVSQV